MAADVKWYGDSILAQVKVAGQRMADEAALQIEAQTAVEIVSNGQVDTGFMLNSVYSVTSGGSSFNPGQAERAYRIALPPPDVPEGGAVVGVAAEYALWQELENSFLFRAAEIVAGTMGAPIIDAGKEVLE